MIRTLIVTALALIGVAHFAVHATRLGGPVFAADAGVESRPMSGLFAAREATSPAFHRTRGTRFMGGLIVVSASYDPGARLWTAYSNDLGGVFLQATSWTVLVASVPPAVSKLLPRKLFQPAHDIAIEIVSHDPARNETLGSIHSRA